jgi:D-aspartate ligase
MNSTTNSSYPAAPVLLTAGNYLGTLAAARELGRRGIKVALAESSGGTIVASSRYVRRELRSPPIEDARRWVAWMLAFGEREPGHSLFSGSDDVCWLLDWHRDEFDRHFLVYQPPGERMYELLNKRKLYDHCRALGIDQPRQWTAAEALGEPASLEYPVLLKPCTQAGLCASPKGLVCEQPAALATTIATALRTYRYCDEMMRYDPEVPEPIVQAFHGESEQHVYSLAGFYAPECDVFLLRAAEKVLQHPMRVGVGLCFESRSVQWELALQLRALFDRVGYCGPFEVEYIAVAAVPRRYLLIDVNPRFYGQMAFDIARGLPIATLCHAAARANWTAVKELARQSDGGGEQPTRFCDAWLLRLYATTHLVSGNIGVQQWRSWLSWASSDSAADAVSVPDDREPAARLHWQVGRNFLRHPRSSARKFFVR